MVGQLQPTKLPSGQRNFAVVDDDGLALLLVTLAHGIRDLGHPVRLGPNQISPEDIFGLRSLNFFRCRIAIGADKISGGGIVVEQIALLVFVSATTQEVLVDVVVDAAVHPLGVCYDSLPIGVMGVG